MFTNRIPNDPSMLNEIIDTLLKKMSEVECTSNEYARMADQLTKLYKIKEIDTNVKLKVIESLMKQDDLAHAQDFKAEELRRSTMLKQEELTLKTEETNATIHLREAETTLKQIDAEDRHRVSKETLALIAANLLGIALILGHERLNVITTKALGFVTKMK